MRFEEALNGYIHQIGITAKDLADAQRLVHGGYQPLPKRGAYARAGLRTASQSLQGVGSPCAA